MITYGSTTLTSYNTITKIEVYYYKSTSATDLAGGSWSTTKPTWENGKYIWQKIRTTYEGKLANGQFYSESDPVNITGQQGATGTAAYSYKLNASDTIVGRTKTGQYTVNEITFTATYKQGTGAVTAYAGRFKIETTLNGTDWTTAVSSTANESSKKFTIPENIIAIKCSLYQAGGLTVLLDIMTVPIVKDGVDAIGLRNTIPYYLASDKDTGVTRDEIGWSRYTPQLTADKKYLWVYYASRYSEGNSEPELIDIKDDVVSFENHGEISPSEGCVVDINPVQDCNGYDKPWIAGGGVNKFDIDNIETVVGAYGLTTSIDGDVVRISGTFTATSSGVSYHIIRHDQPIIEGAKFAVFRLDTSSIRISCRYASTSDNSIVVEMNNVTPNTDVDVRFRFMIYTGSTAPTSYSPYSNICPITGRTNIDINQHGKNWLQLPEYNEIKTYELQASYHKVPIKVLPNTDYYLHTEYLNDYTSKGKNNCYVLMTASPNGNTDWKAVGRSSNGIVDGVMHSTSDGYLFLKVYQSCSQEVYDELKNNCKTILSIGTTASTYEPYKKQDYIYDVRFDDNLSLIKTDNEPYQFRNNEIPTAFQVDRLEDEIVGGSIVWNQLYQILNASYTDKGLTAVASEDKSTFTINGATTTTGGAFGMAVKNVKDHVYYYHGHLSDATNMYFSAQTFGSDVDNDGQIVKSTSENANWYYVFTIKNNVAVGTVFENVTARPQVFDLTQMFGTEIANYLYNLEQNEAGAGVAWFRKYFPNKYYEYNAGEIKSVEKLQSHDMVGFNLLDINDLLPGQPNQPTYKGGTYSKPIRVISNKEYYFKQDEYVDGVYIRQFDSENNDLGDDFSTTKYGTNNIKFSFTTSPNTQFILIRWYKSNTDEAIFERIKNNHPSLNLSQKKRDGEYEPYINHSYPLDSSLILRGIPKISTEGNLYYDGDRYKSDGTVIRKYGIVDLGTLNWAYQESFVRFTASTSLPQKALSKSASLICAKYEGNIKAYTDADRTDKIICTSSNGNGLLVRDSSYTDATSFKTAMSGVYLVYELATPTTEKGAPYQSLQTIDLYGTEEYITNSIIPVGHETKYYSRAVYGGQLDMTNGILTVDRARLTFTGDPTKEAWYLYSPDNFNADCFNIIIPNKKIGNSTSICDKFSNIITCWGANGDNKYGVYSDHPTLNRFYFRQPNTDITTIDKWKEWLSENPVTVCYELADPIIYQLTPQELTMLAGQNYIYSDSGQTNIRYYDNQTSTEPRIDYTFMSAYDTAQMINNAVGTLEAPYTELEWVESTGKQYVYLDWKPPIKTWGFEADFICRNLIGSTGGNVWNEETNANGYGTIFGTRNASAVNDCMLTSYATGYIKIGGGSISDIGFERNKRIVMKMHGTTFTKPDGTTKTLTRLNETANKPYWNMTVFAYHQGLRQAGYGGVNEPSSTRIYSLKFFDGDTLTVDLVGAIRKSDRTTGLYDKVSKHFYPAPGLLYGNEVGDIGEIASIKQSMLKTNPQTIVVNKNRTRMWEATVPFDHLEDGQKLTVTYSYGNVVNSIETEKLAGWTDTSSNQQIYLKLTLSNGNQTDWIPCYYSNTGRLTTHYGSGIPIVFTYRENMLAGASETSSGYAIMRGFYADANYDSNTIYTQFASAVKAGTNGVKRYTLIMRDSDNTYSSFINQANTLGTTKTAYTGGFVLGKIYYSSGGAEYATGANTSAIWSTYQVDLRYDFNITTSGATALTLYKPVYLVGTVHDDDGLFYLDTTQWWTQTEPTSEDGKVYVFIGQTYSAYQSWLAVDNTAYQYYDGKFMPYETVRTLKSINTLQETLENQIDGKVETWCQINDPATAWTTADLKNQHDGDLWYYIGESNTTYKNNTTYKYTASTGKWTAYSASTDLFDRIDSKSTVYYGKPSAITQNLEVGDYLVDNTDGCSYRWDGSKWVKLTDYKTAIDNIEIGGRNLLLNSATEKTGASNVAQWMQWAISESPLIANEDYIFSFDAKMSNNADVFYIGFALNSSTQEIMEQEVLVTDTYKRYTYKVKTTKTNINSIIISNAKSYGHGNANNSTGILNIKNIKLEKGNKATKWTPAPEDIENAIQSAQSKADEAWAATQPIMSKTYENVTITANNDPKGWLYFGTVKPTNYYVPWKIRYKLHAYINGITDSHQQSEVMIEGAKNTYYAYRTYNMIANTNYRPVYAYSLYTLKEAGVNNNYGHLIGIRFQSAYWADLTSDKRTVEIEIIESTNCTVSFADEMFLYTDAPGTGSTNYYNRYSFDGTTQGYTGSGDRNETNHVLNNFSGKTGVLGIWSAGLFMRDGNGTYQNICTNSAGAISRTLDTTKKPNPNGFEIGSQIYYSPWNAYNANSNINGSVYASYGAFDSRYCLNTTLTNNCLTPYEPVYLVGTVRTDGLYYLDTVWWTQTPTDSSKTYVLIGGCYDSTTSYCRINLYEENNWYKYVNGKLEDYTNRLAELASTTATAYITDTTDNGIMVHPENDTTSGWSIASAIELFKSGISYIKLWIDNNIPKIRIGREDQGHLILDNDSVNVMENTNNNLASFGKETTIGGENSSRFVLSPNEITGQYKDGNESFHIYNYYTTKTGEKDIIENQKITPYSQSNNGNTFQYTLQNAPIIDPQGTINIIVIGYNNNKEEIASASQTLEYKYFYDSSNNPIRLTVNGEVFEEWTYDENGNLIGVDEYHSAIEGISYDISGDRPKTGDIFDIIYEPFSGRYVEVTTSSNITSINLQVSYITLAEIQIPNPYYTFGSRLGVSQGSYSFTVGKNNTASAECSVALGACCKANANYSYAEGKDTTASGYYSHAEGYETASGSAYTHAEGCRTIASSPGSHAEGQETTASGSWSHAEGYATTASGSWSHAEGHTTTASGNHSHAQNYGTQALSYAQTTMGKWNIADNTEKYALIIGNGSNNSRSNALTVAWEGNVEMALNTTASSGTTDADLYDAITALGWGNDVLI